MKLYYSPGACSLSPHIVAQEAGIACELIQADLKSHTLKDQTDFYTINPLGYVPFLVLDDGQTLREGPVIAQYLADQAPAKNLLGPVGSMERYRALEWLNFIGTELHKNFGPLFDPGMPAEAKERFKAKLADRLQHVDGLLAGKTWLMGDDFTVADGYLFTVTNWAQPMQIDLSPYQNLTAYRQRVAARPAVQAAMKAEGLI